MDERNTYKIEVDGTEIKEYYLLRRNLEPAQVKQMWIQDVESKGGFHRRLAGAFKGGVRVTRIGTHSDPHQIPGRTIVMGEEKEKQLYHDAIIND